MSDAEDDDEIDEEENEDEEEEDEEEEEEEEEDEGLSPEEKAKAVQDDIDIIYDIFKYIDQTSRRLTDRLKLEDELEKIDSRRQREAHILGGEPRRGNSNNAGPPVSWDQYESLNDAERATLLERALTALATDDSTPSYSNGGNSKPAYYSYNR